MRKNSSKTIFKMHHNHTCYALISICSESQNVATVDIGNYFHYRCLRHGHNFSQYTPPSQGRAPIAAVSPKPIGKLTVIAYRFRFVSHLYFSLRR